MVRILPKPPCTFPISNHRALPSSDHLFNQLIHGLLLQNISFESESAVLEVELENGLVVIVEIANVFSEGLKICSLLGGRAGDQTIDIRVSFS